MSQTREPSIDLDRVAGELASLHAAWSKQGFTAGPLTSRDAQAACPSRSSPDRSQVAEPESVGITMTTAWENEALIVIWRGGWADVEARAGTEVIVRAPELHDVADCITLAESRATQLATGPASEQAETWGPSHIKPSQPVAHQVRLGTRCSRQCAAGAWPDMTHINRLQMPEPS